MSLNLYRFPDRRENAPLRTAGSSQRSIDLNGTILPEYRCNTLVLGVVRQDGEQPSS